MKAPLTKTELQDKAGLFAFKTLLLCTKETAKDPCENGFSMLKTFLKYVMCPLKLPLLTCV